MIGLPLECVLDWVSPLLARFVRTAAVVVVVVVAVVVVVVAPPTELPLSLFFLFRPLLVAVCKISISLQYDIMLFNTKIGHTHFAYF